MPFGSFEIVRGYGFVVQCIGGPVLHHCPWVFSVALSVLSVFVGMPGVLLTHLL
jgi:hypothetical protein